VCMVMWELAFASTWCAVAALTSLTLLQWVQRDQNPTTPPNAPHEPATGALDRAGISDAAR
jgi:hypothetical protein